MRFMCWEIVITSGQSPDSRTCFYSSTVATSSLIAVAATKRFGFSPRRCAHAPYHLIYRIRAATCGEPASVYSAGAPWGARSKSLGAEAGVNLARRLRIRNFVHPTLIRGMGNWYDHAYRCMMHEYAAGRRRRRWQSRHRRVDSLNRIVWRFMYLTTRPLMPRLTICVHGRGSG